MQRFAECIVAFLLAQTSIPSFLNPLLLARQSYPPPSPFPPPT